MNMDEVSWAKYSLYALAIGAIALAIYLTNSGTPLWALLLFGDMHFKFKGTSIDLKDKNDDGEKK